MAEDLLLEMRGITKRFGPVVANAGCSLAVRRGEIHALLGENGAGKTTLMNILYGMYHADEGEIRFKGRPVHVADANHAIAMGIGMVHQHFMLVPVFTVTQNIILGREPRRSGGRLKMEAATAEVERLSREFGLTVDPGARVETISVGMQQRVEILKALYRGAELLILDEPTAVLTPQEVHELGMILRRLVEQGRTIIFITHKLKEVLALADRVTVIRRGQNVGTLDVRGTDTPPDDRELARMMVGRDVTLRVEKAPAQPGAPALEVRDLHALSNKGLPALKGINLTLHAGEIVGLAGVDGNGQTELIECLTGLRRITSGSIKVAGQELSQASVGERLASGIGHIPEDRHKRGLVLEFNLAENVILGKHTRPPVARRGLLQYPAIYALAARIIADFDVRTPGALVPARTLSGGNQQKLIVGREIDREPQVLVAAQPTRGLDVGAIEFIHQRLVAERDHGRAVLVVSLELDEILSLADRIVVIYEGQIVAEMPAAEATEEQLGLLMAGGGRPAPPHAEGGDR